MNDFTQNWLEDEQAMNELMLDIQRKAEEVARRMETGTTTQEDAMWFRAEYGLTKEH